MTAEASRPPTALARRFVRYVVGFGVGVAVGMAPFLGVLEVPGFQALVSLYPRELRATLIPLSAFLMGLVAVAVQFYAGSSISRRALGRRFRRGLAVLLIGFLLMIVLYTLFVVRVELDGGESAVAVTVGWTRLPSCGCTAESDVDCVGELSLSSRAIESCWGGRQLRVVRLILILSYLLVTGGFGALVGLLLLSEEKRRLARSR